MYTREYHLEQVNKLHDLHEQLSRIVENTVDQDIRRHRMGFLHFEIEQKLGTMLDSTTDVIDCSIDSLNLDMFGL